MAAGPRNVTYHNSWRYSACTHLNIDEYFVTWYWWSSSSLSAVPHVVSGMNFPKNFYNLLMMSPSHRHLVFLSPVHHHHHHHHHHFHYASLHLCSTPNSKLTFSINHSHHSLPHLFGRISRIFMTTTGLLIVFFCFVFLQGLKYFKIPITHIRGAEGSTPKALKGVKYGEAVSPFPTGGRV